MMPEHYRRQSLSSIWNLCWNIKLHVRETDWKVVKGLLNWSRLIPAFFFSKPWYRFPTTTIIFFKQEFQPQLDSHFSRTDGEILWRQNFIVLTSINCLLSVFLRSWLRVDVGHESTRQLRPGLRKWRTFYQSRNIRQRSLSEQQFIWKSQALKLETYLNDI